MAKPARSHAPDPRLPKALSHPLRAEALAILNECIASPNEIAQALGVRLENVGYHVRVLHDLGCIELVRTARRRGAIEHYYRAVERPHVIDRGHVVIRFNDGGELQGTDEADGSVHVDAPTPLSG